jgi:uncharacterized integral membrane protein
MELNNSPWSLVALGGLFAVLGLLWTDRFYYFAMPFIAVALLVAGLAGGVRAVILSLGFQKAARLGDQYGLGPTEPN